jgi:hypothetical protein
MATIKNNNLHMKKCYLLLALCVLIGGASYAQQDSINTNKKRENLIYGIGLGAGFTTGYGISFKYLPNKFGFQVNFAPYMDESTTRHSAGISFIYTLINTKHSQLYLYQGNHFYYNSQVNNVYAYTTNGTDIYTKSKYTQSYFNNGVGVGVRVFLGNRIEANIMTGYAAYDNFRKVNITGEAALYYRF